MESVILAFVFGAGTVLVSIFFKSYVGKKAENLATKEDIATITQKTEAVRLEFTTKFEALVQENRLALQESAQHHSLRLAALDRRLEIHQAAYARCFRLYFSAHEDDAVEAAEDCLQWWRENCLYLGRGASNAFVRACIATRMHKGLIGKVAEERLEENWNDIDGAWDRVAAEVSLPSVGEAVVHSTELTARGRARESNFALPK